MSTSIELRIERPSLVYERLRMMIIRGRLAPGVRVVEIDVAQRLGVSRTPARETIQRLFQEGFLASVSQHARTELVVAPLTEDDMWDLYLTMAALEGAAALDVERLSVVDRRALATNLAKAEASFERAARHKKDDFDALFDLHNAFHETLVSACARPRLRSLIAMVRPQVDRYEWVYAPKVGPDFRDTFTEHTKVIAAVRAGSGRRVQRAIAENWERGAARLGRIIGMVGGRGDW
jgi:DNA-binding GntR family transcriptional regulator